MNISKLDRAIKNFLEKKEANKTYYEENWNERKERKEFYQTFTKEKYYLCQRKLSLNI